ncbi:MAG: L,D-transpeptidase, partial [Endomicrobia bacterium]|nr:L,D-transpeptidase [Endomicrobiia bacterium]
MIKFILLLLFFNYYGNTKESLHLKIVVSISHQKLYVYKNDKIIKSYPVSTSKYGIGNKVGSNKTPLGMHRIKKKVGHNAPIGMIFISLK